jgi:F-type H+-transporting ATPase subunit epsilon
MTLEIVTPEKFSFTGTVRSVTLPGSVGAFTVLEGHAPLLALLKAGEIIYKNGKTENRLKITAGFAEVKKNEVIVCAELPA